jgi:hypothetical protein
MSEEGDGPQDNAFVRRKVLKILKELLSDECIMCMPGHQHFGFKLSSDVKGGQGIGWWCQWITEF